MSALSSWRALPSAGAIVGVVVSVDGDGDGDGDVAVGVSKGT